jgi:hypothetical protein
MEEWKMGKFDNSIIRQFDNGKMEEWNNGKPKSKPQRGVILIAKNDNRAFIRCSAPEYSYKPQPRKNGAGMAKCL